MGVGVGVFVGALINFFFFFFSLSYGHGIQLTKGVISSQRYTKNEKQPDSDKEMVI